MIIPKETVLLISWNGVRVPFGVVGAIPTPSILWMALMLYNNIYFISIQFHQKESRVEFVFWSIMLYDLEKRMQKVAAWDEDGVVGNFVHLDSLNRSDAFVIFSRGLVHIIWQGIGSADTNSSLGISPFLVLIYIPLLG